MLKKISPLISPDLLVALYCAGHGDEIVLADAHFPALTCNKNVVRADGLKIADLLKAIMPLFELDAYVDNPLVMMEAVSGDTLDPEVERSYMDAIRQSDPNVKVPERIDRFAFYERTQTAFAVVVTGETAKYGNIILKKGVIPVED